MQFPAWSNRASSAAPESPDSLKCNLHWPSPPAKEAIQVPSSACSGVLGLLLNSFGKMKRKTAITATAIMMTFALDGFFAICGGAAWYGALFAAGDGAVWYGTLFASGGGAAWCGTLFAILFPQFGQNAISSLSCCPHLVQNIFSFPPSRRLCGDLSQRCSPWGVVLPFPSPRRRSR